MEKEGVGGREEVEGEGSGEKGGSRRSEEVEEREGLYGDRGEHWRGGRGVGGGKVVGEVERGTPAEHVWIVEGD